MAYGSPSSTVSAATGTPSPLPDRGRALIFLDVDGVLNSLRSMIAYHGAGEKALDAVAIRLLDRLCVALTDAGYAPEIIISSTWRLMRPRIRWWTDLWAHHGCIATRTTGMTPSLSDNDPYRRGREIQQWLRAEGGCAPYVCLDDDTDFLPGQPLVWVDPDYGLSADHLADAYSLITGEIMPHHTRTLGYLSTTPAEGHGTNTSDSGGKNHE